MNDLEKLTYLMGSPKKAAERLKVSLRTYWNYTVHIPEAKREYIALVLREEQEKKLYSEKSEAQKIEAIAAGRKAG